MAKAKLPSEIVARNMRVARMAYGWSQENVAMRMRSLGFAWEQSHVTKCERGHRAVTLDEYFALATSLDLQPHVLASPRMRVFVMARD